MEFSAIAQKSLETLIVLSFLLAIRTAILAVARMALRHNP